MPANWQGRGRFQAKRGDPTGGKPRRAKPDHGHGRQRAQTRGYQKAVIEKPKELAPPYEVPPPVSAVVVYLSAPAPSTRPCQWCERQGETMLAGLAFGLLRRRLCYDCCAVAVTIDRRPTTSVIA